MKAALFIAICGIGLAGCQQSSSTSQTSTAAPSGVAANDVSTNNDASANNNVAANNTYAAATPATQPDNTGINTRDRSADAVTASSQGESQSDLNVTADIRRRIMNGNLSVSAQNVKVICLNGKVTLRGPVNSQDEKDTIGRMAADVAGAENVDNELDINPNG